LIKLRTVEEIVLRQFHKYLKMFEKKELEERVREDANKKDIRPCYRSQGRICVKKGKKNIYLLSRIKKEKVQEFVKDQLRKKYIRPLRSSQMLLVFFIPKKDEKKSFEQSAGNLKTYSAELFVIR